MAEDLNSFLLEAFDRHQQQAAATGAPPDTYGSFLDAAARQFEQQGKADKARAIRNAQVAQQAAGKSFGQVVEDAATGSTAETGAALRGMRTREQAGALERSREDVARSDATQAAIAPSLLNKAAESVLLGGLRYGSDLSLGLSDKLAGAVAGATEDYSPFKDSMRGSGADLMEKSKDVMREDTGLAGQVAEGAGAGLAYLTPAGMVGKLGKSLQATEKARPILNLLGRALESPILNYPLAGSLMRGGRAGVQAASGDAAGALKTLQEMPTAAANDALMGVASVPFKLFGNAIERGLLKTTVPQTALGQLWGRTLGEMPKRYIAQAALAKFGGGMAEFAPFSFVPHLTEQEWKVLWDPSKVGDDEWKGTLTSIGQRTVKSALDDGIAGALTGGVLGVLSGGAMSRPGGHAAESQLRRLTAEELHRVNQEIGKVAENAADHPEIAQEMLSFLAESQRLKEGVAAVRGDIKGDVADFGRRVGEWASKRGVESGMLKEVDAPSGTGKGDNAPDASTSGGEATPAPAPAATSAVEKQPGLLGRMFGKARTAAARAIGGKELRNALDTRWHDTVTGLSNADAWQVAKPKIEAAGLHVATGDLGEFKAVNDKLGHKAGDVVLKKVGDRLLAAAKASGIETRNAFRSGGDEFSVAGTEAQIAKFHEILKTLGPVEHEGHKVHTDFGTTAEYDALPAAAQAAHQAAEKVPLTSFVKADYMAREAKKARKAKAGIGTREQEAAKASAAKPAPPAAKMETPAPTTKPPTTKPKDAAAAPRVVTATDLPDAAGAESTKWYHGSGTPDLSPENLDTIGRSDPQGLVGMGQYLTDSSSVAEGYAKARGKKGTPTVYEARVKPRAVLNFEHPLPKEVAAEIQGTATSISDAAGEGVQAAVAAGKSGMDVYKALREGLAYDEVSVSDATEALQGLQGRLRDLGYDAITHIGGQRVGGKGAHRVLVVLDPNHGYSKEGEWIQPYENPVKSFAPQKSAGTAEKAPVPETKAPAGETPAPIPETKTPPQETPAPEAPKPPDVPERPAVVSRGKAVTIKLGNDTVRAAHYALLPQASLLPSHNPQNAFAWNEGYPRQNKLQERDYATQPAEQQKVGEIAKGLDPADVISTDARATGGPPMTSLDGTVINGNGRAQGLLSASPEKQAAYRAYLKEHLSDFGLSESQFEKMKDPVLVRAVDIDPRTEDAADLGRLGNMGATQAVGPIERAARVAHLIPDDVLDALGGDETSTFSQSVVDVSKGRKFRDALYKELAPEERAEFFNNDRTLTEAGKELAENVMLTKALGPEQVKRIPKGLRGALTDAVPQLARLKREPQLAEVFETVNEGLDHYMQTLDGGRVPPAEAFDEPSLIAPPPISAAGRTMLDFLYENRKAGKRMREGFTRLLEMRGQEGGLLGAEPAAETVRRALTPKDDTASAEEVFGMPSIAAERHGDLVPRQVSQLTVTDATLGMPMPVLTRPQQGPANPDPTPEWRGYGRGLRAQRKARVGRHEIIDKLAEVLGWPFRVNRLGPQNAGMTGIAKMRAEVIRTRDSSSVPEAIHEFGHGLDPIVFPQIQAGPFAQRVAIYHEFHAAGFDAYQGMPPPKAGFVREGFAEYVRMRVTEPVEARKQFPEATKWWDAFEATNPKLKEGLAAIADLHQQYEAQGALMRDRADRRLREESVRKRVEGWWLTHTFEELAPLKIAFAYAKKRGATIADIQNGYLVAKARRGAADGVVHGWVEARQRGMGNEDLGPGLNEIFRKAGIRGKENLEKFESYLAAHRAMDYFDRGLDPGMRRADAEAVIASYENQLGPKGQAIGRKWQQAASEVWKWNENVLEYGVQAGVYSRDFVDRILKGSTRYVPMHRFIDAEGGGLLSEQGTGTPILGRKGAGLQRLDVLAGMIEQARTTVAHVHNLEVRQRVADLSKFQGMGKFVERIPQDVIEKHFGLDQIKKQLEGEGADLTNVDPKLILSMWEPKTLPGGKDPIVPVQRPDGTTEWYMVRKDLYDSLNGIQAVRLSNKAMRFFSTLRTVKVLGATGLNPSFAVTNTIRDLQTFIVNSQHENPVMAVADWAKNQGMALAGTVAGRELSKFAQFLEGQGATLAASRLNPGSRGVRHVVDTLGMSRKERIAHNPAELVDLLRDLVNFSEIAPRAAAAEGIARQRGVLDDLRKGLPIDHETAMLMNLAGRETTVDFSAGAKWARYYNQISPFFNAPFQGVRAFGRAYKRNPVGTSMRGIAALTIPTLFLWWRNKDNPDYKDMVPEERYRYWHHFLDNGNVIRVPRQQEAGHLFASLPEAVFDALYRHDPARFTEAIGPIFDASNPFPIGPSIHAEAGKFGIKWEAAGLPAGLGEVSEQVANQDTFKGAPIVSEAQKGLAESEQYGPYTTEVAKWIGKKAAGAIGEGWWSSPVRIDHAIRGVFAGLGSEGTSIVDSLSKSKSRNPEYADMPVIGTLFRRGGAAGTGSRAINRLYELKAAAEERQKSKENPETGDEMVARQKINDATTAIGVLRAFQRDAPELADRQELQRRMRAIAEGATAEAERIGREGAGPEGPKAERAALIGRIGRAISEVRKATDGADELAPLSEEQRQGLISRQESIIEALARKLEAKGGDPDIIRTVIRNRLQIAKDKSARRPKRDPGRSFGFAPDQEEANALQEEMLPAGR